MRLFLAARAMRWIALALGVTTSLSAGFLPAATSAASLAPAVVGTARPFNAQSSASDYALAKAAMQWLPQVKRAVGESVAAGLLKPSEQQLWENILLGQIGIESVGQAFIVPNPSSTNYSQGLTQLTYPTLYREENPFDPMTNLRAVLRTTIRYYRMWGNRWDRAIGQYLTGSEDENVQRHTTDWMGTDGQQYVQRMVNIVWEAALLAQANDLYPARDNALQAGCGGSSCWFDHAPPWSIWDSPALPFNWTPPKNNTAYWYIQSGLESSFQAPIAMTTWDPIPAWFLATSPSPSTPAFAPRQPSPSEAAAYPIGVTANDRPHQETYPRRTWTLANP